MRQLCKYVESSQQAFAANDGEFSSTLTQLLPQLSCASSFPLV
jgi:hypothetical protein